MLLAIDVGNTNLCFGIYDGGEMKGSFRLKTDPDRTSDEIGLFACDYFRRFGLDPEEVEDVIIASVVPTIMHTLANAMMKYFGREPIIIVDEAEAGLKLGVESDEHLGPDRSVACVAAMARYGAPCVVLDFGTATTLDALNAKGEYMGGCITAGVKVSADALSSKTSLLPRVELARPEKVLNTTAVGHIQAGVVLGYIGSIEYLVRLAKEELGAEDCKVIATGGLARMVADNTPVIDVVDRDLVLDGLRLIYEKKQAEQ
ncbi:type III pantothenate kinase [Pseudoflavonifractor phocaeensis]|uniref:type III pantothenate kinase n=1 Tax=Pseudoflavonifractor phocaeensis TaxID=1870988 RepID=UPI00313ACD2A